MFSVGWEKVRARVQSFVEKQNISPSMYFFRVGVGEKKVLHQEKDIGKLKIIQSNDTIGMKVC